MLANIYKASWYHSLLRLLDAEFDGKIHDQRRDFSQSNAIVYCIQGNTPLPFAIILIGVIPFHSPLSYQTKNIVDDLHVYYNVVMYGTNVIYNIISYCIMSKIKYLDIKMFSIVFHVGCEGGDITEKI